MSSIALDLQNILHDLDAVSASKLERLVRDAMDLARPANTGSTTAEVDKNGWPVGHFERYAGCLADEEWEPPKDPAPEPPPE